MVLQTIQGSHMRVVSVPCVSGSYLWYDVKPEEVEHIRQEVRDPKPSVDSEPVPLTALLEAA